MRRTILVEAFIKTGTEPRAGKWFWKGALVALFIVAPAAAPAQPLEKQAAELARLRGQLEEMESDLVRERAATSAELKALSAQKTEISLLIQKEKIRLAILQKERGRQMARLEADSARSAQLKPALMAAAREVRQVVQKSLPFQKEKRLGELRRIEKGVSTQTLTVHSGFSQLWQLVEDELKLCRESGLYQQVIDLQGKRVLADVARLGMAVLLFRTPDGQLGFARRQTGGQFEFVRAQQASVQQGIAAVFDALRKQTRSGTFTIPLPPLPSLSQGA